MEHTLLTSAVVTRSDGGFYHRNEHEWRHLDDQMLGWLVAKMAAYAVFAEKLAAKSDKEDSEVLSAVLLASVDGAPSAALPNKTISGLSYDDLIKCEREWLKISAEAVDLGDDLAKVKKAKKAAKGNP